MYKMIVLDLDGTLLKDNKEISLENIKMIKRAYEEKGVVTVIATGRPLMFVKELCEIHNDCFGNYIIACNGAIIHNNYTNENVYEMALNKEEILNIRRLYEEGNGKYLMLYTEDEAIKEVNGQENGDTNKRTNSKEPRLNRIDDEVNSNPDTKGLICVLGGANNTLESIINEFKDDEAIETSVICKYFYKNGDDVYESNYIDIMRKGCSKHNAILRIADMLGISQEEIIVMGDGGNDISMFECAGLKIAMENGVDFLKEKADYITASNNDDGVAKAIDKFIFGDDK